MLSKLGLTWEKVERGLCVGTLAVDRDARVLVSNCKAVVAGADVHAQGHATARVNLENVKVVVVHVKGINQLYLAGRGEDNDPVVVVGGQEPQLARLHHALDGGGGSKDTKIINHQEPVSNEFQKLEQIYKEPVNSLHIPVPPSKATGDQVMTIHVKVAQST